uniref:UBA domain-containing protein n=2 Tax=Alexandrium monilatum TaxID=311494 RepID=A0A7S4S5T5_9DINO|mmetsp:Transcript_107728/g.322220  ORF Transcript_107728/g.322220 Transcript_107728/m.322220 type:complete len:585 (+) Transcript_107728:87-1841(+)
MEVFEDQVNSIRSEWHALREKWFHGETIDPVFEGVVRDFCTFDEVMQNVHMKVGIFMRGVEQLARGMTALSDGVSAGLAHARQNDSQLASDTCKMKEATNQIARADAPHSAIAKLRRDMHFNILGPVQNHIANNRNLKVSLDIRRRRLIELSSAKKQLDDCAKKNMPRTDRRYLQAQSNFESAKMTFHEVDRHVFEWLYILEEYRGDILDSTLQTLKYLEYEFFAASAHAISTSLPTRMEFRPMVEMTPEHLEAQVEMELKESEDGGGAVAATGTTESPFADFSARLIDKKAKEEPSDGDQGPALPVDPLSLSSLLSQGFEEGPARRALRLHRNDTQAAMDWLIDGQHEEVQKQKQASDGVRMPTTIKRVQKLKAMRKAQQEKMKEKQQQSEQQKEEAESHREGATPGKSGGSAASGAAAASFRDGQAAEAARTPDLLEDLVEMGTRDSPPKPESAAVADLLSLDEVPTDFSRPVERTALPAQLAFDTTRCEKQPLPAAVAAGIAHPRSGSSGNGLPMVQAQGSAQPPSGGAGGPPAWTGLEALDPLAVPFGQPPSAAAASGASRDRFGDLAALAAGGSRTQPR